MPTLNMPLMKFEIVCFCSYKTSHALVIISYIGYYAPGAEFFLVGGRIFFATFGRDSASDKYLIYVHCT